MEIKVRTKEQQAIDNLKAIVNSKDKIIEIEPPIEDTAQILLDYITNLQEELKYQKQAEQEYNEKHTKLMKKYKELQESKEKAKEFIIEKCITSDVWKEQKFNKFIPIGHIKYKSLSSKNIEKLCNILGGE